jgi:hypothetical protein
MLKNSARNCSGERAEGRVELKFNIAPPASRLGPVPRSKG